MELDSRLKGAVVVGSVSGGKDSTAMSLWLTEQGIEHRVFADTGWEHPATYEFLREVLPRYLGPIDWVRGEYTFATLVESRGIFPQGVPGKQFCSTDLKFKPIQTYIAGLDGPVNAIGIRAAESARRAKLSEWEWSDDLDCWVWRPLIRWTEADVIAIHTRHGCPPNPLYLRGATRVGCWPCINANKAELVMFAADPDRVGAVRELERRVDAAARLRHAERGRPPEEYRQRTYFRRMGALRAEGDGGAPLDDVLAWAKTGRGGRQYDLIAEAREPGCVRWGLCDTGGDELP